VDEIAAFRSLKGANTPPGSDLGIARARHLLLERIDAEARAGRRPFGSPRRKVLTVVGLAAAISSIALGLVTIGNEPPRAEAAAVEVLNSAADHVVQLRLPALHPGQYLLQERVQVTWGSAGDANRDVLLGRDGKPVVWATRRIAEVWIPYDPSDEWVVRERVVPFGFASKDAVSFAGKPEDDVWKARNGVFGSHWTYKHPSQYAALYRDFPRDPEKLLSYVKEHPSGEGASDADAFDDIGEILRDGSAPADLRSALYQALTHIPKVSLVSDSANLAGQSGVAVEYPGEGQLIFNPKTGAFIGERNVSPDFPTVPGLGPDKVTFSTVVTTHVVDRAPIDEATTPPSN
jgi:hypothetical protein